MREFYLLSLKHSPGFGGCLLWWGPDDCGYCSDLCSAGIYTEKQIRARLSYYDNDHTVPVPVEFVAQVLRVRRVVENSDSKNLVLNSGETLRETIRQWTATTSPAA